jgi:hypothetical protein
LNQRTAMNITGRRESRYSLSDQPGAAYSE